MQKPGQRVTELREDRLDPVNKSVLRVALLVRYVSVMRCDVQVLVGISIMQHF
jgi:hypothetical protein